MGKEATATFIGHKECYGVQAEDVRREVEKLIASGVTDFLNGGMGGIGNISDIPAWLLLMALIFATVVGLLSGIAPANRAVKISALEAIRHE